MRLTIGDGVAEKTGSGASCPLRGQTRKIRASNWEAALPSRTEVAGQARQVRKGPKGRNRKVSLSKDGQSCATVGRQASCRHLIC